MIQSRARIGIGRSFGTFGELMQGILPDGRPFLVTLPLARYATARFRPTATGGVQVYPRHKEKARRMAEALLHECRSGVGGVLMLQSQLPEGKGLASSSADLAAAARAVQSACGFSIAAERLARLMASIEPTDGVIFPGVVSFYHRQGELRRFLGPLPELTIVAVDEGGIVDTEEFNRQPPRCAVRDQIRYQELLLRMEKALMEGDLPVIGECATQSAILHQPILPKRHLDWFLELRRKYQALGVAVAHSGTYIGLLLSPANPGYAHQLASLEAELSQEGLAFSRMKTHRCRQIRSPLAKGCVRETAERELSHGG